ncbi:MAG TPA: isochorismatase family cysteine hydrolase [Candidatus Elarobacter sp.]|nr:isochorismatase family cysteine hydrolase [Candidatus Elarobacter sp.]
MDPSSLAPDFASVALVTIDTQRDTLDGQPFEVPGTSAALPEMRRLAAAFRAAGRPIVHVVRLYRPDGSNVDLCRRRAVADGARLVLAGSPGAELASDLVPASAPRLDTELLLAGGIQRVGPGEAIIYKPRWGAFFQTPLEAHLRALGVSTLVFAGCNFPNCPRTSIYEASERDFRLVLVEDAVSGLYERGKDELRGIGVALMNAAELTASLLSSPAHAS